MDGFESSHLDIHCSYTSGYNLRQWAHPGPACPSLAFYHQDSISTKPFGPVNRANMVGLEPSESYLLIPNLANNRGSGFIPIPDTVYGLSPTASSQPAHVLCLPRYIHHPEVPLPPTP